mmetsp:Transcript_13059/g.39463  ORF Transcript_13059/g.39463 Transcript_13059/m.39463 type:complete len:270 (-) Transcript_13059:70-879(-)
MILCHASVCSHLITTRSMISGRRKALNDDATKEHHTKRAIPRQERLRHDDANSSANSSDSKTLGDDAAGVGFAGLLVEHLGLFGEVVGAFDEVVELFAALEEVVDGLVEDGLGVVEVLLNFGDFVVVDGVLHLHDRFLQRRVVLSLRQRSPVRHVRGELLQNFVERGIGRARRVLGVGGHRGAEPVRPHVHVHLVLLHLLLVHRHALPRRHALHDRLREERNHLPHREPLKVTEARQVLRLRQHHRLPPRLHLEQRQRQHLHPPTQPAT